MRAVGTGPATTTVRAPVTGSRTVVSVQSLRLSAVVEKTQDEYGTASRIVTLSSLPVGALYLTVSPLLRP